MSPQRLQSKRAKLDQPPDTKQLVLRTAGTSCGLGGIWKDTPGVLGGRQPKVSVVMCRILQRHDSSVIFIRKQWAQTFSVRCFGWFKYILLTA